MSESDDAGKMEMDQLMRTIPPMDVTMAAALLREAKEVFDELGVVFFLRQGTCLGAVRDGAFIPWDDDIDLGSIYGMHGLTKRSVASVADAFRARGFHVEAATSSGEYVARHHEAPHTDRLVLLPRSQGPHRPLPERVDPGGGVRSPPRGRLRSARGFSYPVRLKSTFAASTDRTGRRPSVSAMRRTSSITSRLSGWLGPGVSGGSSRPVSRAGPLCFKSSESMASQSRMAKSPWRVWAEAGRTTTATHGATCLGKTYTHWSCGRRDGKRCYMRSSLRPVGGTCTGPTPSGRRGVSSCSQRSADGRGLDPSPLRQPQQQIPDEPPEEVR